MHLSAYMIPYVAPIMRLTTDAWINAFSLPFVVAAGRNSTAGVTDVRDADNGKDTSGKARSPHA